MKERLNFQTEQSVQLIITSRKGVQKEHYGVYIRHGEAKTKNQRRALQNGYFKGVERKNNILKSPEQYITTIYELFTIPLLQYPIFKKTGL